MDNQDVEEQVVMVLDDGEELDYEDAFSMDGSIPSCSKSTTSKERNPNLDEYSSQLRNILKEPLVRYVCLTLTMVHV